MMKQIIIIGAGAAGLTAAVYAARSGADVRILEHTDKAGKKILSTGNGKCNITNRFQEISCYRGNDSSFPQKVLEQFDENDTINFMESLGILCKEKNGYVYPRSEQASTVREGLMMECKRLGVIIEYEVEVQEIHKKEDAFELTAKTRRGNQIYQCDKVILAAGSKAMPKSGSNGSGYELAKSLGLKIIKPLPALVQLKCEEGIYKEAAGVRCGANVKLMVNGELVAEEEGELQITNYGLSGIVVMQVSRFAVKALDGRKQVTAVIDFFSEMKREELYQKLFRMIEKFPEKTIEDILAGFINRKLAGALLKEMGIRKDRIASKCDESYIQGIIKCLKGYQTEVIGSNTFAEAQVCQGGVATKEINPLTMESKKYPGLYFAGEILDVDGTCGGYNLQFAWSTGAIAGTKAGENSE
ncbi:MAG: NAD(P)/FAD-dependent oxidoreductase [Lachnospiraceae bacterium]|nr:NAD(P)/FAD-dependent oxidoreductase [Lachnospiraceae bacterium]